MSGVYDGRMPAFMFQTVDAMRAIRARYTTANERKAAVAIYQSMTEAANDARADQFEAPRKRIAELAGCSVDTVDRYVRGFVELGLLEVRQQRHGNVNLPNVWVLLDRRSSSPAPPSLSGAATPSRTPETGGSRTPEAPIEEGEQQAVEQEKSLSPSKTKGQNGSVARESEALFDAEPGEVGARMAEEAAALRILVDVPRANGSARPTLEAVEKVHERHPNLNMEVLAQDLDFYARHGNGARQQIKSVMGKFAMFAKRAQDDLDRRGASQNAGQRVGSGREAATSGGHQRLDEGWERPNFT